MFAILRTSYDCFRSRTSNIFTGLNIKVPFKQNYSEEVDSKKISIYSGISMSRKHKKKVGGEKGTLTYGEILTEEEFGGEDGTI